MKTRFKVIIKIDNIPSNASTNAFVKKFLTVSMETKSINTYEFQHHKLMSAHSQ